MYIVKEFLALHGLGPWMEVSCFQICLLHRGTFSSFSQPNCDSGSKPKLLNNFKSVARAKTQSYKMILEAISKTL